MTKHPTKADIAPIRNIGLLPNLPINSEIGIRVKATVINWNDNGIVAYSGLGANRIPTKPVWIILIPVLVIESPWAIAKVKTFFFAKSNLLNSFFNWSQVIVLRSVLV